MKGKLIVITGIDGSGKTVQTNLLAKRLEEEGYNVEQIDFPQYGKTFFADMIARYLRGDFNQKNQESENSNTQLRHSGRDACATKQTEFVHATQSSISNPQSINPYFTSLLYAGDRWECVAKIRQWLEEGKIIIANRYACCNMAYQGAKIDNIKEKKRFFDWLNTLEYKVYKIPEPDVIIFLQNEVEIALDLISKRSPKEYHYPESGLNKGLPSKDNRHRDIHEEDIEYLKMVQKTYLELALNENGWKKIECVREGKLLDKNEVAGKVWDAIKNLL